MTDWGSTKALEDIAKSLRMFLALKAADVANQRKVDGKANNLVKEVDFGQALELIAGSILDDMAPELAEIMSKYAE